MKMCTMWLSSDEWVRAEQIWPEQTWDIGLRFWYQALEYWLSTGLEKHMLWSYIARRSWDIYLSFSSFIKVVQYSAVLAAFHDL